VGRHLAWSEEAVGIVGGESKCCKSFLALDLVVAVAGRHRVPAPLHRPAPRARSALRRGGRAPHRAPAARGHLCRRRRRACRCRRPGRPGRARAGQAYAAPPSSMPGAIPIPTCVATVMISASRCGRASDRARHAHRRARARSTCRRAGARGHRSAHRSVPVQLRRRRHGARQYRPPAAILQVARDPPHPHRHPLRAPRSPLGQRPPCQLRRRLRPHGMLSKANRAQSDQGTPSIERAGLHAWASRSARIASQTT
jgi:hypothetical protein